RVCVPGGFASSSHDEFAAFGEGGLPVRSNVVHCGCQAWLDSSQSALSACDARRSPVTPRRVQMCLRKEVRVICLSAATKGPANLASQNRERNALTTLHQRSSRVRGA